MNRDKMATLLFQQNRVLCFFKLSKPEKEDTVARSEELPVMVHHNHYPCIYYQQLHTFFRPLLNETTTKNHIRITIDGKQLPSNYPIGLYLKPNESNVCELGVEVAEQPVEDAFKIVYRAWKQAYNILNPNKGVEHLMKRMKLIEQKEAFEQYAHGAPTQLPEERECIAIRGFYDGRFVERKHKLDGTVLDLMLELWPGLFSQQGTLSPEFKAARVSTHGIPLSTDTPTSSFYQLFPYNDGYWYLSLSLS